MRSPPHDDIAPISALPSRRYLRLRIRVPGAIVALWRLLRGARAYWRDIAELDGFGDRSLRDIGLSRDDLPPRPWSPWDIPL